MKLNVSLKDPEAFSTATSAAVFLESSKWPHPSAQQADGYFNIRRQAVFSVLRSWLDIDGSITIEFDLDNQTATVVKRQQ